MNYNEFNQAKLRKLIDDYCSIPGHSQTTLAAEMNSTGITQSLINSHYNNVVNRPISVKNLIAYCKFFNVTPNYFYDIEESGLTKKDKDHIVSEYTGLNDKQINMLSDAAYLVGLAKKLPKDFTVEDVLNVLDLYEKNGKGYFSFRKPRVYDSPIENFPEIASEEYYIYMNEPQHNLNDFPIISYALSLKRTIEMEYDNCYLVFKHNGNYYNFSGKFMEDDICGIFNNDIQNVLNIYNGLDIVFENDDLLSNIGCCHEAYDCSEDVDFYSFSLPSNNLMPLDVLTYLNSKLLTQETENAVLSHKKRDPVLYAKRTSMESVTKRFMKRNRHD